MRPAVFIDSPAYTEALYQKVVIAILPGNDAAQDLNVYRRRSKGPLGQYMGPK